ncbi:MAG TPA: class I SAM-dependent methyltransferase [bacterium]|nr:class I SAM-dependent methyltransferase [bacterium]
MLKVVPRSWNEFWAYYFRVEHRHRIPEIFDWDRRLVDFIERVCHLEPPARILDLACGGGDQARIFAAKGYRTTGIDIAPSLIDFARRLFREARLEGEFIVGDMRDISYDQKFELCTILSGSFGFFGEEEDRRLLTSVRRALVRGGFVFIMYISPKYRSEHVRSWAKTEKGWDLYESWFEPETQCYRARTFLIQEDGTMIVPKPEPGYYADETIRCYTVDELKSMLAEAGLQYVGDYSSKELNKKSEGKAGASTSDIVVGRRV